mmetsp:Transcript_7258/g.10837  ORF Transcript_7258/g.10837 Transcript_7258/m.10837 type:complete len:260 (-) Transcript_7258:882-1661(-)
MISTTVFSSSKCSTGAAAAGVTVASIGFSSWYDPDKASSGIFPSSRLPRNRATLPTVCFMVPPTTLSATTFAFCLLLRVTFIGVPSSLKPGLSCIRLSSSLSIMFLDIAPITLSVGHGDVTGLIFGHSAPVISVEYLKRSIPRSRSRAFPDCSFTKIESHPPPAPPLPEIWPSFSNASAPRPSRGPPFQDQYTPDLLQRGSCATWKSLWPASSSPTNPPVMYFIKMGKYFRNQSRFSRKRGLSAMHPGYMLLKSMPVIL